MVTMRSVSSSVTRRPVGHAPPFYHPGFHAQLLLHPAGQGSAAVDEQLGALELREVAAEPQQQLFVIHHVPAYLDYLDHIRNFIDLNVYALERLAARGCERAMRSIDGAQRNLERAYTLRSDSFQYLL